MILVQQPLCLAFCMNTLSTTGSDIDSVASQGVSNTQSTTQSTAAGAAINGP